MTPDIQMTTEENNNADTDCQNSTDRGCCSKCRRIHDVRTKFGTLLGGLLLTAAGAALLYFGFHNDLVREEGKKRPNGEINRDNKIFLTFGFICVLLGLFGFVLSILMFKDVECLKEDNKYKVEEEA